MTPTRSHRRPPYRLAAVMITGLVVFMAVQLVFQVPKAVAAVNVKTSR